MLHQGKLIHWDPIQGQGFIQQDKAGPAIQITSADFRKKPELLQDGDAIFFQIELNQFGQPKASRAYKAGQRFAPLSNLKQPSTSSYQFQKLLSVLVTVSIVAWLGYQFVYLFNAEAGSSSIEESRLEPEVQSFSAAVKQTDSPVWPPLQLAEFSCEGKTRCTEMNSCEEAQFYLAQCPDVQIDGDADGIPCEREHCQYNLK